MSVTTLGFKEFERKLRNLDKKTSQTVTALVYDAAKNWEQLAKQSAPVDKGALQQNITGNIVAPMHGEVNSKMLYSPYVEWGTGTRVRVPSDLQGYAIQFKKSKVTIGRFPHPYFFVHRPLVEKDLFADVIKYLSTPQ